MSKEIISVVKTATIIMQNEVMCNVTGLYDHDLKLLFDKFNIFTKDYIYTPHYKLGVWDGKKAFFSKTGQTYIFLLPKIITLLQQLGYKVIFNDKRTAIIHEITTPIDENYFSHIINEKTQEPYKLAPHQIEAANAALALGNGILLAGTGFGKSQPLTSKVLTPNGWVLMGDIKVGDYVITPKNTTAKVIGVYPQGNTDVYEMKCHDGATVKACGKHLWLIHNDMSTAKNKKNFLVLTTEEIAAKVPIAALYRPKIPLIPVAIDFPNTTKQIVHPYLLGIVIPYITSIEENSIFLSNIPLYMQPKVADTLSRYNISFIKHNARLFEITSANETINNMLMDIAELSLDFDNIKIPSNYIYCQANDRAQFFKGLCDSYGKITNTGVISLNFMKLSLVLQLQEMTWLQGGTSKINQKGDKSSIVIYHKDPCLFFSINDRVINYLNYNVNAYNNVSLKNRRIDAVKLVSNEPTQCILIDDPDHLYITDNCIITHNTILNAVLIDVYGQQECKTITIVPSKSLVVQTINQFIKLQLDVGQYDGDVKDIDHQHIVSTWQTLQNNPNLIRLFQVVIVDECLSGDTKITMYDNTTKYIKDILPGDVILSYNEFKKIYEKDVVIKCHNNISANERFYLLTFDNNTSIKVTGNHKIMTTDGYVRADKLTENHIVLHHNNTAITN